MERLFKEEIKIIHLNAYKYQSNILIVLYLISHIYVLYVLDYVSLHVPLSMLYTIYFMIFRMRVSGTSLSKAS